MTFCQLIEYIMRNIFFKNHTLHVMEKLVPDPFLKNKLSIFVNRLPEILYSLFLLYAQVEDYLNVLKLRC